MEAGEHAAPIRQRGRAWPLLLLALVGAAAGLAWRERWIELPPNALPWDVPDLTQPPGMFAHLQVGGLVERPERCFAALSDADVKYTRVQDRVTGDRCGYTNAVRLDGLPIPLEHRPTASCGLAAALAWYEHELGAGAERTLHARIVRIEHLGTFACRNVNSESDGQRSEHATANAIDVAGYVLSNGRVVTVARDWNKPTPEGRFLADAHDAACRVFNGVLGPDYNRLHADHFHLDLGPYRICR